MFISEKTILDCLTPLQTSICVIDQSHLHAKHYEGSSNGLTHIKLMIQKPKNFMGLSKVKQHQEIYRLLGDLLKNGLHAIAIDIKEEQ